MDVDSIKAELHCADWESLFAGTVEESWSAFKDILDSLRLKYVPLRKRNPCIVKTIKLLSF